MRLSGKHKISANKKIKRKTFNCTVAKHMTMSSTFVLYPRQVHMHDAVNTIVYFEVYVIDIISRYVWVRGDYRFGELLFNESRLCAYIK